jgi:hypothetical protein
MKFVFHPWNLKTSLNNLTQRLGRREVFPCFFLSCKANARVILAKMGHGLHSCSVVNLCGTFINLGCIINL